MLLPSIADISPILLVPDPSSSSSSSSSLPALSSMSVVPGSVGIHPRAVSDDHDEALLSESDLDGRPADNHRNIDPETDTERGRTGVRGLLYYKSVHFRSSHTLEWIYTHRYYILITLAAIATMAIFLTPKSIISQTHTAADVGGATSGIEIHLYRQRPALSSGWMLPSQLNSQDTEKQRPYASLAHLITNSPHVLFSPGLNTLVSCVSSSSRVAVMTSISVAPTAAEVGLSLLSEPWCTLVIGDKKGPNHTVFINNVEIGVRAYLDKMSKTNNLETPGDGKIDRKQVMSRIAYIDIHEQTLLPYALSSLTPYGSFSRKNLGFLLAMHSGASVIFDVDDDNIYVPNTGVTGNRDLPIDAKPLKYPSAAPLAYQTTGRVYKEDNILPSNSHSHMPFSAPPKSSLHDVSVSVFNPYPVYGASDSWPRGFPLRYVKPTLKNYDAQCIADTRYCSAVVQQMLANHDPDVDAIYRLTNSVGVPFDFLAKKGGMTSPSAAVAAPSIALPVNVFTPFNAQATIITPGAFFAMLLPYTVHGRVSDIWRSYVMETLLSYYTVDTDRDWAKSIKSSAASKSEAQSGPVVDPCIVFTAPHIYHDRNSHNYQQDFNSEMPLYMSAEALVSWLTVRQRGGERDLLTRVYSMKGVSATAHSSAVNGAAAESLMADIMMLLYVDLYEAGVVEEAELAYAQAWLSDVQRITTRRKALTAIGIELKSPACMPSVKE